MDVSFLRLPAAVALALLAACGNGSDNGLGSTGDSGRGCAHPATWYGDADGDGYGAAAYAVTACTQPSGYVSDNTDCDDSIADVNPGATEQCDGLDDDCNGQVDDGVETTTWYADADGDGYGDAGASMSARAQPTGYVSDNTDCNDSNVDVHPDAPEQCNGVDDDCNGQVDDNVEVITWYADADGDGEGNPASTVDDCAQPDGYVSNSDDCDDTDAAVNTTATEVCDGIDDNCDGRIDEAGASGETTWHRDSDGDGYGDSRISKTACDEPKGYVDNSDDCDDTDSSVSPAASDDTCDGVDNNCDGTVDEGCSYSVWAGNLEYTYGVSTRPRDYTCDIFWVTSSTSSTTCTGCDFAFDLSLTYDSAASTDDGTCSSLETDFSGVYGYTSDYAGYGPYLVFEYGTGTYPVFPAKFDSSTGKLIYWYGIKDYYYGRRGYYAYDYLTSYFYGSATVK